VTALSQLVPVNFGLKYRPPKLGVQYHLLGQPEVTFVHEIPLTHITQQSNLDLSTKDLIDQNLVYLNPKMVSSG
jgi:hypothetical protein